MIEPEVVAAVLDDAGFDGGAILARATTPANKRRLLDAGAAAIELGVFGLPTMLADGELFWGDDSIADSIGRFYFGSTSDASWRSIKFPTPTPTPTPWR